MWKWIIGIGVAALLFWAIASMTPNRNTGNGMIQTQHEVTNIPTAPTATGKNQGIGGSEAGAGNMANGGYGGPGVGPADGRVPVTGTR